MVKRVCRAVARFRVEKRSIMLANKIASASTVWFLVGPLDSAETTRYLPVYTAPFVIGRRQDLTLSLPCNTVSSLHAEISEAGGTLVLRDLGSTNGTYLNGRRLTGPVTLREDDLVQFANLAFRVRQQAAHNNTQTVQENVCDRALALVQFDKLMAERAVTPFFQPIVSIADNEVVGYEVLARSRLFGLETPKEMFGVATQLNLEVELSTMLRWEGMQASRDLPQCANLFVNTHPRELADPGLLMSLQTLRESNPSQQVTLEIHESAVTNVTRMAELRAALAQLNIRLAYDDFGAGQARLNELITAPPDYLKFDISLIHGINAATAQRQQILATLVQMVRNLGIISLAEGIETAEERATCLELGFDLAQGYYCGRPAPAKKYRLPR
jgi:EAL domain-containing protein (putative c-di-GMP-specific phosphodiesterase class I)